MLKNIIIILFLILSLIFGYLYFNIFYFEAKDYSFAGNRVNEHSIEKLEKEFELSVSKVFKYFLYKTRYEKYIPYIEKRILEEGIPRDFIYLPIVESGLREEALSNKGALGMWQFMPETAKRFGLIVSDDIDERLDYKKSTEAAIKYIKHLYDIFEDWTLAAAAYNRGENGLLNSIKAQSTENYYDLSLNIETGAYIYRIIWVKEIME